MEIRPLIGFLGILVAATTVELNDAVSSAALPNIEGGLGISSDSGTWFVSLYAIGEVIGMSLATWWAVTLTARRFSLFACALACGTTLLIPYTPNFALLYIVRFLQGLSAGFIIPLLLLVGLKVLAPEILLYGLAAYAMTATFAPNISTALAALWADVVHWQFIFYEDLPLFALAASFIWYGMPVEKPQYNRVRLFDLRAELLVIVAAFALVTTLEQGNRLDWFNSKLICLTTLISVVAIPLLVYVEMSRPLPLYMFSLLKRRNVAYALITLVSFLVIAQSSSSIPNSFLQQVRGLLPLQEYQLTLMIACLQLIMLPLVAFILNYQAVDWRVVSFVGFSCVLTACIGDSFLTSDWNRDQFYLWQILQTVGEPMIVLPLLMAAANSVERPEEGPPGSTLINTARAVAEPVGVWVTQLIQRWRGGLHSDRILDQVGQTRYAVIQAQGLVPGDLPPLLPTGRPRSPDSIFHFMSSIEAQVAVLTYSDAFVFFACLTLAVMMVLLLLPEHTDPPRIVWARRQARR